MQPKTKYLLILVPLSLTIFIPWTANAETITLLKSFSSQNGTVSFLPGAWVSVWEDRKSTYYRYDGKEFIKTDKLPDNLKDWDADSSSVDYLDQISIKSYDPGIDRFLPKLSKVKKVIETSLRSKDGGDLVFVCYTLKNTDPYAELNPQDIYLSVLTVARDASNPTYTMLKTEKLESEASYGELNVQQIGKLGTFLVLYWGSSSADSSFDSVDIYKISIE